MRRWATVLVAAVGAMAAAGGWAVPAGAAVAPDTAAPALVDLGLTPDAVSVSGVDLARVTVQAHLTDDSGMHPDRAPVAVLSRVSGGSALKEGVVLRLASGTVRDGVWTGTAHVPSTWDGGWRVTYLTAVDAEGNELAVDPGDASMVARLAVTGTRQPVLTMRFRPDPVVGSGPLTVEGRVQYADTGAGIPNVDLFIGVDNECVEYTPRSNARTDARGGYSHTFDSVYHHQMLHCVGVLRPSGGIDIPAFIVSRAECPRVKLVVTATANRTSVPAGGRVTFTVRVAPVTDRAQLQRRDGDTWRTVATASFQGRPGQVKATLHHTPPGAGTHQYRVRVPNGAEAALSGVSETIVVEVTGDGDVLPVTGPSVRLLALVAFALALVGGGALLLLAGRSRVAARVTD